MLTVSARLSRRTRFGFTLIELVVVLVILAVIAALAVPALQAVQRRTHDEVAVLELQALHREAAALAALSGGHAISADDVETATSDVAAAGQVVRERPRLTVDPATGQVARSVPSEAYGNVSWDVGHDPEHRDVVDLAMVSRAGNCAFLRGDVTTTLVADIVEVDVSAGGCVADVSSPPPGGGSTPSDEVAAEPVAPILDPYPPVFSPDPEGGDTSNTIHEPAPAGTDPGELAGGIFALASFPSSHSAPPHKLYATLPDAGAIVEITDNGAIPASATLLSTAFGAPAGIAAGPDPTADDRAYRVAYVTDRAAGTVSKWDVATGQVTVVTSGLSSPGSIAGWACFDTATGDRVGGRDVCAYVATDTGIVQVNLGTGAKSTLSSHGDVVGLAPRVVGGQPRLVLARAGDPALTPTSLAGVDDAALATLTAPAGLHVYGPDTLVADAGSGKLRSVSDTGTVTDLATVSGVTAAHYHGVSGIAYGANDSCVYRAQAGAATTLWCTTSGDIYVLDSAKLTVYGTDGQAAWTYPVASGSTGLKVATLRGADAVIVSRNDAMRAVVERVSADGAKWSTMLPADVNLDAALVVVDRSTDDIYVGTRYGWNTPDKSIWRLESGTGQILWSDTGVGGTSWDNPSVGIMASRVVLSEKGGSRAAIRARADGALVADLPLSDLRQVEGDLRSDASFIANIAGKEVHRIDASTGATLMTSGDLAALYSATLTQPRFGHDGFLYVQGAYNELFKLDPDDLSVVWVDGRRFETGMSINLRGQMSTTSGGTTARAGQGDWKVLRTAADGTHLPTIDHGTTIVGVAVD